MDIQLLSELFEAGRYQQCLSEIKSQSISKSETLWLEGACLTRLHDYKGGLDKFAASWEKNGDAKSGVSYVRALASLGFVEQAESLNQKLIAQWPALDLQVCRAAFSKFKSGNVSAVVPLLTQGWQNNSKSPFLFITIDFFQRLLEGKSHSDIPAEYRQHPQLSPFVEAYDFCMKVRQDGAKLLAFPVEPLLLGVQNKPKKGWIAEFGVFWGRSINLIAKRCEQNIYGFDSFAGLPEDWKSGEEKGAYSTEGVLPKVANNVKLIPGWFKETLPQFLAEQSEPASLIHIDCDLYSSTREVLELVKASLQVGTVIVFDDFLAFPDYAKHEKKAFEEFAEEYKVEYEVIAVALLSREITVRITGL